MVRYVVLVGLFQKASLVSKAIRWLDAEPLPRRLQVLGKQDGPGLAEMKSLWSDIKGQAPTGLLRSDLYLLEDLCEAKYELIRLGNVIPPPEGVPTPNAWQRARDHWTQRENVARRGLAKINVAPLAALVPAGAKPAKEGQPLKDRDLADLVG